MRYTPAPNDSADILWKKIAWNFYEWALANGITGLTPPSWGENIPSLKKKIAYYTATIVDTP